MFAPVDIKGFPSWKTPVSAAPLTLAKGPHGRDSSMISQWQDISQGIGCARKQNVCCLFFPVKKDKFGTDTGFLSQIGNRLGYVFLV